LHGNYLVNSSQIRLSSLDQLDGRTTAAKETREFAAALTTDIGCDPSAAQRALIEQASCMRALCADYGRRWLSGELPPNEIPLWLASNNNLRRLLETVGLQRVARDVSLDSYLAQRNQRPPLGDSEAS
jgi:hypothetical protein